MAMESHTEEIERTTRSIELETAIPCALSASYKGSFAYKTVKDRMPIILTKLIDYLYRKREVLASRFGKESREDLKQIIGHLSQLRSEIQTNKPLGTIEVDSEDRVLWKQFLSAAAVEYETVTWFDSPWLLVECYMYRKIREAFEGSIFFKNFDPWSEQKENALEAALGTIKLTSDHLGQLNQSIEPKGEKKLFCEFLELSLWANRHDLSISAGELQKHHSDPVAKLVELRQNLVVDHTDLVWDHFNKTSRGTVGKYFTISYSFSFFVFFFFLLEGATTCFFFFSKHTCTHISRYI
ncbi:damage-control phosphatase ARMT1-like isoform X1 [Artemia franciscana]|uniref:damage-control phosphatase ARMT1-like isoform X1 n=1 Tax=Artemia franciscana TaxID=6661 RepID=UPI0032DA7FD9